MDAAISRQLQDKIYEKRKAAAHELEKQIRELHQVGEEKRISQIIDQLVDLFSNVLNPLHVRNGGLIGLAGTAIALLTDIAPYLERFVDPLLTCFTDAEPRIRYFSAECLYNIAKVSKGEILVYFNSIFDGLSKLSADVELSVKNGAELLDRLMKDVIAESASVYIPQYPETIRLSELNHQNGVLIPRPDWKPEDIDGSGSTNKAFSLAHFIPLLAERIYVVSPFARSFLVSWITVLDSVPELELVSYLPEFLDGLMKYLSDPTQDVKVATENLLADFLREIRDITILQRREQEKKAARVKEAPEQASVEDETDTGTWLPGQGVWIDHPAIIEILIQQLDSSTPEIIQQTALFWLSSYLQFNPSTIIPFTPDLIPLILPNLAHHVDGIRASARGCNSLLWGVIKDLEIADTDGTEEVTSSSTGSLPVSAQVTATIAAGNVLQARRNSNTVAQAAESGPASGSGTSAATITATATGTGRGTFVSPPPSQLAVPTRGRASLKDGAETPQTLASGSPVSEKISLPASAANSVPTSATFKRPGTGHGHTPSPSIGTAAAAAAPTPADQAQQDGNGPTQVVTVTSTSFPTELSRAGSPLLNSSPDSMNPLAITAAGAAADNSKAAEAREPFDYLATVDALRIQFMGEHEDTRVSALKWLIMLHQKIPKKILALDDGTFPALLKTLSDPSEEVIKHDLLLLAQICSSSTEAYFRSFITKLLELFSTDRRLLETRGSLIIRQLCLSLQTERIYRSLAEILEREEDLEFASLMVQTLNIILITSPELSDFRKRLKTLDTRQDGQALFTTLYRSWCHNAVAVFSLCLLAQAYEHASNLLQIIAEFEITVQLLVQIDRLVQLIESPIFTYLRLQLLEPEKHPYLYKCLYGLLMLLPQSTAFGSLRNRLNAVNSMGFIHLNPRGAVATMTSRSKIPAREEIKWQELLSHFRIVQTRHEKARRGTLIAGMGGVDGSVYPLSVAGTTSTTAGVGGSTSGAGMMLSSIVSPTEKLQLGSGTFAGASGPSPTRPVMRRKATNALNTTTGVGSGDMTIRAPVKSNGFLSALAGGPSISNTSGTSSTAPQGQAQSGQIPPKRTVSLNPKA